MPKQSRKSEWLTPAQVGEMLGISKQRVSQLIKSGRLPTITIDKKYYVSPADVESLKDRRIGRPRKVESSDDADVWEVTIKATVKIRRKSGNEIEKDEDSGADE
jgi:helix-turn-helix protein